MLSSHDVDDDDGAEVGPTENLNEWKKVSVVREAMELDLRIS